MKCNICNTRESQEDFNQCLHCEIKMDEEAYELRLEKQEQQYEGVDEE